MPGNDGKGRPHLSIHRGLGLAAAPIASLIIAACGNQPGLGGDDQDGISGGNSAFAVTVDDSAFAPAILKTENLATVTLTLTNQGTRPHGFAVACKPNGCFPGDATIEPLAPGESATRKFETPWVEGIYTFSYGVVEIAIDTYNLLGLHYGDDTQFFFSNWSFSKGQHPASPATHYVAAPPRTILGSLGLYF